MFLFLIEPNSDPETGEAQVNAPLAIPDSSESFEDTEPMVEFKVVDQGSDKRPVVLQEIGKQPSKFFISETQKKAKVERQRNLLLMAVAYSANIGGMDNTGNLQIVGIQFVRSSV